MQSLIRSFLNSGARTLYNDHSAFTYVLRLLQKTARIKHIRKFESFLVEAGGLSFPSIVTSSGHRGLCLWIDSQLLVGRGILLTKAHRGQRRKTTEKKRIEYLLQESFPARMPLVSLTWGAELFFCSFSWTNENPSYRVSPRLFSWELVKRALRPCHLEKLLALQLQNLIRSRMPSFPTSSGNRLRQASHNNGVW